MRAEIAAALALLLWTTRAAAQEQVTIGGTRSEARRLQESADAVNVVDTARAQKQTADLGEVLARTQGVSVRRDGGLGSNARFSLNGLEGDQIRFFLDGVPLELAGFPFGIANVPVNLVERVEVYRGVVPIRLGADALGGAVNLVTPTRIENRLAASYQIGSFGTQRVTVEGRYRHEPTGLYVGASAFLDLAKNDYAVDVEAPDQRGRLQPVTIHRFHDGYRAGGGALEAGIIDRSWAKRLSLRVFASAYDKDVQSNVIMTTPYGEVTANEAVYGATARYEVNLREDLELEVVASWAHREIGFEDRSPWVYDWFGRRQRVRRVAGEIGSAPTEQYFVQNAFFARPGLAWSFGPGHVLRVTSTPQSTSRSGDERLETNPAQRDPLSARRDLFTLVSGLAYEGSFLGDRLANVAFLKDYVYRANAEDPLQGGVFKKINESDHALGAGDELRFRIVDGLIAKASYEFARRLPRPDEVFGNGILVRPNLLLAPEVSHNANLGPRLERRGTRVGDVMIDVNGFVRESDRLIVLLGDNSSSSYQNVYSAHGRGVESATAWTSPVWHDTRISLDAMLTWQDVRNASTEGTFGRFEGDRIPNRPWLFASWGARLRFAGFPTSRDAIEPFYVGRYVHEFYRSWESSGAVQYKQTIDAQISHGAGVTWSIVRDDLRLTGTLEVANLTDERLYDNYGVQRPGRAFYAKVTGEL